MVDGTDLLIRCDGGFLASADVRSTQTLNVGGMRTRHWEWLPTQLLRTTETELLEILPRFSALLDYAAGDPPMSPPAAPAPRHLQPAFAAEHTPGGPACSWAAEEDSSRRGAVGRAARRADGDDPQQSRAGTRVPRPGRSGARRARARRGGLPDPAGCEPPRHGRPADGPRAADAGGSGKRGAGRAVGPGMAIRPRSRRHSRWRPDRPGPAQVWRGQHPDGPGPGREARRQRDTTGRI